MSYDTNGQKTPFISIFYFPTTCLHEDEKIDEMALQYQVWSLDNQVKKKLNKVKISTTVNFQILSYIDV